MSDSNIEKFIISLGFADDEAVKGLKGFLGKVDKAGKQTQQRINKAKNATLKLQSKENSLLAARNALERKIQQAQKSGIDTKSYEQSLRQAKKLETIRRRTLELDSKIIKATPATNENKKKLKDLKSSNKAEKRLQEQAAKEQDRLDKREASEKLKDLVSNNKAKKKLQEEAARNQKKLDELEARKEIKDLVSHNKAKKKLQEQAARHEKKLDELEAREELKDLISNNKAKKKLQKDAAKEQERLDNQIAAKQKRLTEEAFRREASFTRRINKLRNSPKFRQFAENNSLGASRVNQQLDSIQSKSKQKGLSALEILNLNMAYDNLTASLTRSSTAVGRHKRATLGLHTAQTGLADSTRNMVRSYASLFAIMAGTGAINRVGQNFEAINSAMLAAMGTQESAKEQMLFLDQVTDRLGLSIADTADQYTKFTFAAKGKLSTEEVNELFQSMAEMGTVLGVSKERMKLSFTAIQQMMNKTTVQSEELKRQFAESMPGKILPHCVVIHI